MSVFTMCFPQVGLLKTNGVGSAKAVYVYPTVSPVDILKDREISFKYSLANGQLSSNWSSKYKKEPLQVSLMSHSCVANLEVVNPPSRSIAFRVKRPVSLFDNSHLRIVFSESLIIPISTLFSTLELATYAICCT